MGDVLFLHMVKSSQVDCFKLSTEGYLDCRSGPFVELSWGTCNNISVIESADMC